YWGRNYCRCDPGQNCKLLSQGRSKRRIIKKRSFKKRVTLIFYIIAVSFKVALFEPKSVARSLRNSQGLVQIVAESSKSKNFNHKKFEKTNIVIICISTTYKIRQW